MRHYHLISGHSGKEHFLSFIREKLWIVKARVTQYGTSSITVLAVSIDNLLLVYRRWQISQEIELLPGSLPLVSLAWIVLALFWSKEDEVKRYGVLYTFLVTRAVHIEVAYSMDTDSVINLMRRFIARGGTPELMRTDNGTNFVGGNEVLVPPSLNGMCSKLTGSSCRGTSSGSLILLQALTTRESGSVASGRLERSSTQF